MYIINSRYVHYGIPVVFVDRTTNLYKTLQDTTLKNVLNINDPACTYTSWFKLNDLSLSSYKKMSFAFSPWYSSLTHEQFERGT